MTNPLSAPIDLAPDQLDGLFPRHPDSGRPEDVPQLHAVQRAMADAFAQAEALVALSDALARDPTLTTSAAALRLDGEAEKTGARALARLDGAAENIAKEIAAQAKSISAPPMSPTTLAQVGAQTLAGIRAIAPEHRRAALMEAIDRGDMETLGSVLRYSAPASGLTYEDHDAVREAYQRRYQPAGLKLLGLFEKAEKTLARGRGALVGFLANVADEVAVQNARNAVRRTSEAQATLHAARTGVDTGA